MQTVAQLLNHRAHCTSLVPGQYSGGSRSSSGGSSRGACIARALRKIGNNPQRSYAFEVNVQRLFDSSFTPNRHIGPVEVATLPGRGRGVLAREDLPAGSLLFVSEPVGNMLQCQLGQQLQPQHLLQHWQTTQPGLSAADRVKLSLLYRPGSSSQPAVSFKDFSSSKASTKAKKAAAKGFGAAPAKPQQLAAAAAAELSDEQLAAVVASNAYGDDHTDGALTYCRQEQQCSMIGVFPEFSLLNHSCAPNTAAPVLLKDRLLLRTAVAVPAGNELTTSYLGLAGGMPSQQRQQLLQQHYGFVCKCHRCKAEEQAPTGVSAILQDMHEWSSSIDAPQLLQLMAESDSSSTEALQDIHHKASQWVQQFEQQLGRVDEPVLVHWLRASAYGCYALMLRTGEFLAGVKDVTAARRLAELVRVFAPASEPHLLLLSDSAVRAAEAAAAGAAPSAPEDTQELRVQQLVRALALRYGEPKETDTLTQLAGSVNASLSPNWLGLIDLDGCMGLQKLIEKLEAAKAGSSATTAAATAAAAAEGVPPMGSGGDQGARQKVELDVKQLGMLQ